MFWGNSLSLHSAILSITRSPTFLAVYAMMLVDASCKCQAIKRSRHPTQFIHIIALQFSLVSTALHHRQDSFIGFALDVSNCRTNDPKVSVTQTFYRLWWTSWSHTAPLSNIHLPHIYIYIYIYLRKYITHHMHILNMFVREQIQQYWPNQGNHGTNFKAARATPVSQATTAHNCPEGVDAS